MKLTITEKRENLLLERTEVKGRINFEGSTPSNREVAEAIGRELKKEVGLVVIKKIRTLFSRREADFQATVYNNLEARQKIEKKTKHLRKKEEEERKKIVDEAGKKKEDSEKGSKEKSKEGES